MAKLCYHRDKETHHIPSFSMKPQFWAFTALLGLSVALVSVAMPQGSSLAQVYNGPGLTSGTTGISGVQSGSLRTVVANIVNRILTYVSLAAVIVIIIAGLYLILSLGNDTAKETAKKIIIYTAIGLILILISKGLVMFFIGLVTPSAATPSIIITP